MMNIKVFDLCDKGTNTEVSTVILILTNHGAERLAYKIQTQSVKWYRIKLYKGFLDSYKTIHIQGVIAFLLRLILEESVVNISSHI